MQKCSKSNTNTLSKKAFNNYYLIHNPPKLCTQMNPLLNSAKHDNHVLCTTATAHLQTQLLPADSSTSLIPNPEGQYCI